MAFAVPSAGPSSLHSTPLMHDEVNLRGLLEQARSLETGTRTAATALPTVTLGLEQIESQSRVLAARAQRELASLPEGISGRDLRAQYLLAGAEVNTDNLSHELDRLDPLAAFVQLQPLHDNDIEGLSRHAHEATIISAIEDARKRIIADFYRGLQAELHSSWDREKQAVFDELARHAPGAAAAASSNNAGPSQNRTKPAVLEALRSQPESVGPLHARLRRYDRVVALLNGHRKEGRPCDLVRAFADCSVDDGRAESGTKPRLAAVWKLLLHLVRDHAASDGSEPRSVPQRSFAAAYHGPDDSSSAVKLRRSLVVGGCAYLEEQCATLCPFPDAFDHVASFMSNVVDRELADNAAQAQLGGVPSVRNKIAAFVRLQLAKQKWPQVENVAGAPVWAHIFFLLRCGHAKQAAACAHEHAEALAASGAPDFGAYFSRWVSAPEGRLARNDLDAVSSYYASRLRHGPTVDPFKLALYKLMCRADLGKKRLPAVTDRTEDWFWLQLRLTREGDEPNAAERWSLSDLGHDIANRYGPDTLGSAYLPLLLMCGRFEQAVDVLYARGQHQADAVHLAIALVYYGLLRIPQQESRADVDILLRSDVDARYHLDFGRLLYRHYRSFAQASPLDALQYICLLPLAGEATSQAMAQYAICHARVEQLVLETGAYVALLGDAGKDGTIKDGAIALNARLLVPSSTSAQDYVHGLIHSIAHRAEGDKNFASAVVLYHLAAEPDSVMRVINARLGVDLARPTSETSGGLIAAPIGDTTLASAAAKDPMDAAEQVLNFYRQGRPQSLPSAKAIATCVHLIRLKQAFRYFELDQLEHALDAICETDLLPLATSDIPVIMRKAEESKDVDDAIARHFGDIMLLAMTVLYRLHTQLKESPWGDAGRQAKLTEYRRQARSLMMFAGMLRFRLNGNVLERMTRLDVFLH